MSEKAPTSGEFRHIRATQKATESVTPGNELQEATAADIMRLAFEMEVREAFPEEATASPES